MKATLVPMFFLLVLFEDSARGQGNEELLKKRFLSEYSAAAQAWENRFSVATGVVRFTHDFPARQNEPHRVVVYSFKCRLPEMATVTETFEAGVRTGWRVLGYNEKYAFELRRKDGQRDFAIDSLEARAPGRPPPTLPLREYLLSPYGTAGGPVAKIVTSPRFSIRQISPVSRNGRSLLRIEFDSPVDPPASPRKGFVYFGGLEGSIVVSPEERWVLYEYEFRAKKRSSMSWTGRVEYAGTVDGFPVPKRATRGSLSKRPNREIADTQVYEFVEFRFARLRDEEFTLAAFGLPETAAGSTRPPRSGGLGYLFLYLAPAALLAAVVFKIVSYRIKRASEA